MPVRTTLPSHLISSYTSASSLPSAVWDAFQADERGANIMYPHALKVLKAECASAEANGKSIKEHCWITLATRSSGDTEYKLELVLSCTAWALGNYPVFIFTTQPFSGLSLSWLQGRVQLIAAELMRLVPVERVFSVFAPAPITKTFVRIWQDLTGALPVREPYYAASLSFCTRQTFRGRQQSLSSGAVYHLRRGVEADVAEVAMLCKGFAATSEPFVLDDAAALKEAIELIGSGMLWVHDIENDGVKGIASIVATTRQGTGVTAITKVYTNPLYRSRGCAERLVRRVCHHLLFKEQKDSVVLFVAHDNLAAAKVYDRVGFAGLCGKPRVEGVDPWVEVGFHDSQLGHW